MDFTQKFKTNLITDQMHTICFHIHPAMTSIYISFRVPMTINHSCFFFCLSQAIPPKTPSLSHSGPAWEQAAKGFSIFSWNTDQHEVHTPTHSLEGTQFVLHQINHTDNQNHTLYKERESIHKSMMIMILYSVILITISSIGSWNIILKI